jgi:hypothetical protein
MEDHTVPASPLGGRHSRIGAPAERAVADLVAAAGTADEFPSVSGVLPADDADWAAAESRFNRWFTSASDIGPDA